MPIKYKFETESELLKVQTSGIANDLQEAYDYAKKIIAMAIENDSKKVLCDERDVKHSLGVIDTVLLAEQISTTAPIVDRVAVIVDKKDLENVILFETANNNRGLQMFVTTDYHEAIAWLKK